MSTQVLEILLRARAETEAAFQQAIAGAKGVGDAANDAKPKLDAFGGSAGDATGKIQGLAGVLKGDLSGAVTTTIDQMGGLVTGAGAVIGIFGAALIAGHELASSWATWGNNLQNLKEATGLSATELNAWDEAAGVTGVGANKIAMDMERLGTTIEAGGAKAAKGAELLNLDLDKLKESSAGERLQMIEKAIADLGPASDAAKLGLRDLLGKGGLADIPALTLDAQNLRAEIRGISGDEEEAAASAKKWASEMAIVDSWWTKLKHGAGEAAASDFSPIGLMAHYREAIAKSRTESQRLGLLLNDPLRAAQEKYDRSGISNIANKAGPDSEEAKMLDEQIKRHEEQLKRAEEEAKKWEEAEVHAVKTIGEHYTRLRDEYDKNEEIRQKYLDAFGKSTDDQKTELGALIVQFQDVGDAQGGAFTDEQIVNFRKKLDETVNKMQDLVGFTTKEGEVIQGLGPYSASSFDEASKSGEQLHHKLKDMGLTIENSDGTWQRIDRDVQGVKGHVEDIKGPVDLLKDKFEQVDTAVMNIHKGLDLAKGAVDLLGGDQGLTTLIDDFGSIADKVGSAEKVLLNPLSSPFDKVIAGAGVLISLLGGIKDLWKALGFGGPNETDIMKTPEGRKALQDFANANPGSSYDSFNQGPNQTAINYQKQFGTPTIPSHASGSAYVPRTGLAIIHQGEMVLPQPLAQFVRGAAAPSSSSDQSEVLALLRELVAATRSGVGGGPKIEVKVELDGRAFDARISQATRSGRSSVAQSAVRR